MSSPRLIASLLALSAAVLIVSCGEQGSPTNPSSTMASPAFQSTMTEFTDMLADPAGPRLHALDDPTSPEFMVYPPGSGPMPWPPGPPPFAEPGVPVPTPESTTPQLHITVNPLPVPYSGVPVPLFSCRDNRHTWYYNQVLATDTGIPVTFTKRENFFDGRYVSTNTTAVRILGNSGVTLHTQWCSAYPIPHYAQTRFTGRDDNNNTVVISGPLVPMLTPQ